MSTGTWGRVLVGRVVKTAMQKTATVRCERLKEMRKTKRLVARHKNFMAHDPNGVARVGDTVRIEECHRISKHKHHRLVEVLKSDHVPATVPAEDAVNIATS